MDMLRQEGDGIEGANRGDGHFPVHTGQLIFVIRVGNPGAIKHHLPETPGKSGCTFHMKGIGLRIVRSNGQGVTAGQAVWVTAATVLFCCLVVVYSLKIVLGLHGRNMNVSGCSTIRNFYSFEILSPCFATMILHCSACMLLEPTIAWQLNNLARVFGYL